MSDQQQQPQFRIRINDGITASGKRAFDYTVELTVTWEDGQTLRWHTDALLTERDYLQAEMEARDGTRITVASQADPLAGWKAEAAAKGISTGEGE